MALTWGVPTRRSLLPLRSHLSLFVLVQAFEMRKERGYLKWHLFSGRVQMNGFGLEHLNPIRPGIDHNSGADRQGSDLIHPVHLQRLARAGQGRHPDQMAAPEIVAETPMEQIWQLRRAGFQSFQEKSSVRELVFVGRLRKQLQ